MRHRLEYLLLRGLLAMIGWLPDRFVSAWGRGLGRFAFRVVRIRRQVTLDNLRRAFPDWKPEKLEATAEATYVHFGVVFLELMRLHRMSPEELRKRVRMPSGDLFGELREEGRGVVVISAHLGNWEVVGAALRAYGYPFSVMVKTQRNQHVDAMVTANRESTGMEVFRVESGLRPVLRALRANDIIAFVADQDAGRRGMFLPHFGELASVAVGPARIARLARAPVVVGHCSRKPDGSYQVHLSEAIRPQELPAASTEDSGTGRVGKATSREAELEERRILSRYIEVLESAIRAHPEQYFWMHRRWKTRPPKTEAAVEQP